MAVLKKEEGGAPCGQGRAAPVSMISLTPFRPARRSRALGVFALVAAAIGTATMLRAGEALCAMALLTLTVAILLLSATE